MGGLDNFQLPTLVSSDTVMFIDPVRQHLFNLPQNANSQRIHMKKLKYVPLFSRSLTTFSNNQGNFIPGI